MSPPINLADIEAVAKLMAEYRLDSYESPHFTLKKSQHQAPRVVVDAKELLQKHLDPLPAEPWNQITDEDLRARELGKQPG